MATAFFGEFPPNYTTFGYVTGAQSTITASQYYVNEARFTSQSRSHVKTSRFLMSTPRTDTLKATRRARPLMGLLALLMLPFFTSAQVEMLDQVVAIVDDDIILASELQERVQGVRSTMEPRGVEVRDILIRETLDRLILDSIQLQLANLYGVRIPDQQLDESMARLAQQNGLTLEQFRLALEQSGQSYAAAREGLRDDLAIQRVQQGNVMRNINISEQEIDNFLATEEGEAMTQPEYRVVQALLSSGRSEDATTVAAKEKFVDACWTPFRAVPRLRKPYQHPAPILFLVVTWAGANWATSPACLQMSFHRSVLETSPKYALHRASIWCSSPML